MKAASKILLCATLLVGLTYAVCYGADNAALMAKETQKTLTKEAFFRVEPIIRNLVPEQPVQSTNLKWPVFPIKEGNKVVGLLAVSDGWAGDLSGNLVGAASNLGALFAIENGLIYGQHFYGYVNQDAIFVPRYVVQVKATVIDDPEYESLELTTRSQADEKG